MVSFGPLFTASTSPRQRPYGEGILLSYGHMLSPLRCSCCNSEMEKNTVCIHDNSQGCHRTYICKTTSKMFDFAKRNGQSSTIWIAAYFSGSSL